MSTKVKQYIVLALLALSLAACDPGDMGDIMTKKNPVNSAYPVQDCGVKAEELGLCK